MSGGWTVVDANSNRSQPITGITNSGATSPYVAPAPGYQDPVGKMRVSQPRALIDTDFEYGQQPTKWESIALQNGRQSCYYIPQSPLTITAITGNGTTTVTITGTFTVAANSLIYIQNALDSNANGWWFTASGGTNSMTITTTNNVAVGNQFNQALTYVYTGFFYTSCGINVGANAITNSGTTCTATTTYAHGLSAGSLVYVVNTSATTNAPNGAWIVATTPTANTFTFNVVNAPTGTITNSAGSSVIFARPAGYVESRAFDGGVAFSAGAVVPNAQMIRQTRRYFRYQSGKGIQFSTGTSLCPALVVTGITSVGTTATVTSRFPHNLAVGCVVRIEGVDQGPYNGRFTIVSTPTPSTFTYTMSSTAASPATGQIFRVSPVNWYGSSNRVGMFDQQNGLFFEYDGQVLYAVWRNSTTQLSGVVQVTQGNSNVTGIGTQFTTQLIPGDFIVIRGQSYRILTITSDTALVLSQEYRGVTINQGGAILSKTIEVRVPQSQWDDPLDGTGPSRFTLDLTKMQMWYIDYSWYGAGFVRWGLRTTRGQVTYVYQQTNNNQRFEAYMRSGNMPAHYESNGLNPYTILTTSLSTGGTTTTSAAVEITANTIPLTSAANFSAPGVAVIGSESIYYTGISGNNLTGAVRGFNGTPIVRILAGATVTPDSLNLQSVAGFAPAGTIRVVANGATGVIEHIQYANRTGTTLFGLTRARTGGQATAQSFTASATAPVFVEYAAPDTVPSLSHWGSSIIMDGNFDDDKSLVFNFGTTTPLTINAGSTTPVLAIRLAPSADNGTVGLLGAKEIVNRMQLQLVDMAAVSTGTVLINLILNGTCNNFSGSFSAVSSGTQISSSLAQVAVNTSSSATITGGESVTALYSNGVNSIDLGNVRDLGNSILGGGTSNAVPTTQAGLYPDGPDILYIVATNTTGSPITLLARFNWKEAQA